MASPDSAIFLAKIDFMDAPHSPTSEERRIVVISGPPASGKSSLAEPLAKALGFALLTKDVIKEAIFTAMGGPAEDVDYSHRIGAAAMEALWALAPQCPQVILEANFRTASSHERERFAGLPGKKVEIYCRVPLEDAARRFAARALNERHHPAHALREISMEQLAEYAQPFGLSPVIEVDTTIPIDWSSVLRAIREGFNFGRE